MKILIHLGHPAHFYIYKNSILNWKAKGHQVYILIKKKDVLEDLLKNSNLTYYNILKKNRGNTKFGLLTGLIKKCFRLLVFCLNHKPDILTGTSVENSFVGRILHIPVVNVNEDDAAVVPFYARLSYPLADVILNPRVCNSGKWDSKAIKYDSYHELAYLHPNHFTPDRKKVDQYFPSEEPYFIVRFAQLTAHHDKGIRGINAEIAQKILEILLPHGKVYITSERQLEPQFEKYRFHINPLDIHHVMAFAGIYIGDSQTMAAESGVLGVPFVRFNDFVGRIGYLNELEDYYKLGFGVRTKNVEKLYNTISGLVEMPDRKKIFPERKLKMLSDKIDYSKFLSWFIENYPESGNIMKKNSEYQLRFK